jgi:hypothetical protein
MVSTVPYLPLAFSKWVRLRLRHVSIPERKSFEEYRRKISLACIREDDTTMVFPALAVHGDFYGSMGGSSAGYAAENPFLCREAAGHCDGFVVAHRFNPVDQRKDRGFETKSCAYYPGSYVLRPLTLPPFFV